MVYLITSQNVETDVHTISPAERLMMMNNSSYNSSRKMLWDMSDTLWRNSYTKSNVAMCVYGQLRIVSDNIKNLRKHVLNPLQPDVFIHTSQSEDFNEWKLYNKSGGVQAMRVTEPFYWVEHHIEEIAQQNNIHVLRNIKLINSE